MDDSAEDNDSNDAVGGSAATAAATHNTKAAEFPIEGHLESEDEKRARRAKFARRKAAASQEKQRIENGTK